MAYLPIEVTTMLGLGRETQQWQEENVLIAETMDINSWEQVSQKHLLAPLSPLIKTRKDNRLGVWSAKDSGI